MTTWHQLRTWLAQRLGEHLDPGEAAAEARMWLAQGLGRDGAWLASHGREPVSVEELRRVECWMQRRAHGEPLPQILGWAPFCGRRFRVTRDVMIPRPHSESAARAALRWGQELEVDEVVDVGTGCGNLAITLALDSGWRIRATEVSPAALSVARANARALGAAVDFHLGSLLEPLAQVTGLVVANLPYVDPVNLPDLVRDLAFEPEVALVSPEAGTFLNRALLAQARAKGARACLLEHGPGQGAELAEAAREAGWDRVRVLPDALGHDHLLQAESAVVPSRVIPCHACRTS